MANQKIFCNTPWYEAHIYWDGGLGICCQESRRLSTDPKYNIKHTSLREWFNSEPVKKFRFELLGNVESTACERCYQEENVNLTSRRHRSNQKSVIFTKTAFDQSFQQSPGYDHFMLSEREQGLTDTLPIDLHVDLGNHCNLACKFCYDGASSKREYQMVQWGHLDRKKYLNNDWTRDTDTWNRFLKELVDIPKLKNIHLMGGETLLGNRFEEMVDYFIDNDRIDVCFSFVTNGTVFKPQLIEKLKNFPRVGIEISVETMSDHNDYIRQGNDLNQVKENIDKFLDLCDRSDVDITIRPTLTALSIGNYHTLLRYCLGKQLLIKSLLVHGQEHLAVERIPLNIRKSYLSPYQQLMDELADVDISMDFNESDQNRYKESIKLQVIQVINLLNKEVEFDPELFKKMVFECKRWDSVYHLTATELYPELADLFREYGY